MLLKWLVGARLPQPTLLIYLLLLSCVASADPGDLRLTYSNLSVLRVNPQGLQNDWKAEARVDLYGDDPGILLEEGHFLVGPTLYTTPAFVRAGGRVGIRPLAILYVEGRMDWMGSFGTFNHVLGFPDLNGDGSDTGLKELQDAGESIRTTGRITTLTGELRGKVGPVVARSKAAWIHTAMDLLDEDRFWYEGINDVFMPANGWGLHVDTDLLWMDGSPWVAGVRHTVDTVFVDAETQEGTSNPERLEANHRVGPFFAFTWFDRPGEAFNKPTIAVIVNWHLTHPYRAGQHSAQSLPYALIAFAFQGDLLSSSH